MADDLDQDIYQDLIPTDVNPVPEPIVTELQEKVDKYEKLLMKAKREFSELDKNFKCLLNTTRQEIKRKDKQIAELNQVITAKNRKKDGRTEDKCIQTLESVCNCGKSKKEQEKRPSSIERKSKKTNHESNLFDEMAEVAHCEPRPSEKPKRTSNERLSGKKEINSDRTERGKNEFQREKYREFDLRRYISGDLRRDRERQSRHYRSRSPSSHYRRDRRYRSRSRSPIRGRYQSNSRDRARFQRSHSRSREGSHKDKHTRLPVDRSEATPVVNDRTKNIKEDKFVEVENQEKVKEDDESPEEPVAEMVTSNHRPALAPLSEFSEPEEKIQSEHEDGEMSESDLCDDPPEEQPNTDWRKSFRNHRTEAPVVKTLFTLRMEQKLKRQMQEEMAAATEISENSEEKSASVQFSSSEDGKATSGNLQNKLDDEKLCRQVTKIDENQALIISVSENQNPELVTVEESSLSELKETSEEKIAQEPDKGSESGEGKERPSWQQENENEGTLLEEGEIASSPSRADENNENNTAYSTFQIYKLIAMSPVKRCMDLVQFHLGKKINEQLVQEKVDEPKHSFLVEKPSKPLSPMDIFSEHKKETTKTLPQVFHSAIVENDKKCTDSGELVEVIYPKSTEKESAVENNENDEKCAEDGDSVKLMDLSKSVGKESTVANYEKATEKRIEPLMAKNSDNTKSLPVKEKDVGSLKEDSQKVLIVEKGKDTLDDQLLLETTPKCPNPAFDLVRYKIPRKNPGDESKKTKNSPENRLVLKEDEVTRPKTRKVEDNSDSRSNGKDSSRKDGKSHDGLDKKSKTDSRERPNTYSKRKSDHEREKRMHDSGRSASSIHERNVKTEVRKRQKDSPRDETSIDKPRIESDKRTSSKPSTSAFGKYNRSKHESDDKSNKKESRRDGCKREVKTDQRAKKEPSEHLNRETRNSEGSKTDRSKERKSIESGKSVHSENTKSSSRKRKMSEKEPEFIVKLSKVESNTSPSAFVVNSRSARVVREILDAHEKKIKAELEAANSSAARASDEDRIVSKELEDGKSNTLPETSVENLQVSETALLESKDSNNKETLQRNNEKLGNNPVDKEAIEGEIINLVRIPEPDELNVGEDLLLNLVQEISPGDVFSALDKKLTTEEVIMCLNSSMDNAVAAKNPLTPNKSLESHSTSTLSTSTSSKLESSNSIENFEIFKSVVVKSPVKADTPEPTNSSPVRSDRIPDTPDIRPALLDIPKSFIPVRDIHSTPERLCSSPIQSGLPDTPDIRFPLAGMSMYSYMPVNHTTPEKFYSPAKQTCPDTPDIRSAIPGAQFNKLRPTHPHGSDDTHQSHAEPREAKSPSKYISNASQNVNSSKLSSENLAGLGSELTCKTDVSPSIDSSRKTEVSLDPKVSPETEVSPAKSERRRLNEDLEMSDSEREVDCDYSDDDSSDYDSDASAMVNKWF